MPAVDNLSKKYNILDGRQYHNKVKEKKVGEEDMVEKPSCFHRVQRFSNIFC